MAKSQRWTDEWVQLLEHPKPGERERVLADPALNGHRLIVSRTKKTFEIQAQLPSRFRFNGKRRTYKVQTGDALDTTIEQSRERAAVIKARIRKGEDPRGKSPEKETTLRGAWAKYQERTDLKPRTRAMYNDVFDRDLAKFGDISLRQLVDNPSIAQGWHKAIVSRNAPSTADHALRLLRAIYRYAARLDVSLPGDRNPCSAVEFRGDKKRQKASIPRQMMPAWWRQIENLRQKSPLRAAFQVLLLRLGCRPGELASAEWSQVDFEHSTFWIPDSKEEPYEIPLPAQATAEFKRLLEARCLNRGARDYVFPSRLGKRGHAHLTQYTEPRRVLSHSSNQMRHTHHTIGVRLKIDDRVLDPLEGRSILKSGLAGRGYCDVHELGPELRQAQETINQEIDRLREAASD